MSIEASFENLIELFNQAPSIDKLTKYFRSYTSHEITNKLEDNAELATEIIRFLNNLIPVLSPDEDEKNLKRIQKTLDKLGVSNGKLSNEDLAKFLKKEIELFQNTKFNSNFCSFDWQINVIERKNDNMYLSKDEKIEIVGKINSFNNKTQKYQSNVVKMNYNEFIEIFNNFKKIDAQLHLFKQ